MLNKVLDEHFSQKQLACDTGYNSTFFLTKPSTCDVVVSRNYGQKLKKSMSTKIDRSIANLDEILTNKKVREIKDDRVTTSEAKASVKKKFGLGKHFGFKSDDGNMSVVSLTNSSLLTSHINFY